MKLRQKITTNATFVVVFYFSYETRIENNDERASSLSSIFFLALQKTMMNLPTCHYLLQFKKKKENQKKTTRSSSLSSAT
jgi:hypothetical protein